MNEREGTWTCRDTKWKMEKGKKHWSRMAGKTWALEELHALAGDVGSVRDDLLQFNRRMATVKMAEMNIGGVPFELVETRSSPRKDS